MDKFASVFLLFDGLKEDQGRSRKKPKPTILLFLEICVLLAWWDKVGMKDECNARGGNFPREWWIVQVHAFSR